MYRQTQTLKWIDNLSRAYGIFLVPENVQIIPMGYVSKMQCLWRDFVSVLPRVQASLDVSHGQNETFPRQVLQIPELCEPTALSDLMSSWKRQLFTYQFHRDSSRVGSTQLPLVADGRGDSPGKKPPRPPPCALYRRPQFPFSCSTPNCSLGWVLDLV